MSMLPKSIYSSSPEHNDSRGGSSTDSYFHRMLYDFHHDLNLRRPSSCHATYILSGLRRTLDSSPRPPTSEGAKDTEGDEVMGSSPFELSQASSVGEGGSARDGGAEGKGNRFVRSIVLVGEERLEGRFFIRVED